MGEPDSRPLRKVQAGTTPATLQQVPTPDQDAKLRGILDPITKVVEGREKSEVMALAIGASISAVVVKSVDGLTEELFTWASQTSVLGPVYSELQLNLFGAVINIPRIVGILVYILVSLAILAFLAFGILSPLLSRTEKDDPNKDNKK